VELLKQGIMRFEIENTFCVLQSFVAIFFAMLGFGLYAEVLDEKCFAENTIVDKDSDASIFRLKILWIFCFVLISVREEALLSAISIGIGLVPFTPMISIGVIHSG
jgi:hypothetical protein